MSALFIDNVTMRFGGLTAVDGISLAVPENRITAVIGPNGAGKTTLFNCVTGFYRPTAGQIRIGDTRIEGLGSARIAREFGIARTFQNLRLFGGMTVLENLLVAQHRRLMGASLFSLAALAGFRTWKKAQDEAIDFALSCLKVTGIEGVADRVAETLNYGDRRRLEIARALAMEPNILCLDEPAAGLNPSESAALNELLFRLRDDHNLTVLLIEHDMSVVMGVSDHIAVLDYGRKIAEGRPEDIRADPAVIAAYLGVEMDAGA